MSSRFLWAAAGPLWRHCVRWQPNKYCTLRAMLRSSYNPLLWRDNIYTYTHIVVMALHLLLLLLLCAYGHLVQSDSQTVRHSFLLLLFLVSVCSSFFFLFVFFPLSLPVVSWIVSNELCSLREWPLSASSFVAGRGASYTLYVIYIYSEGLTCELIRSTLLVMGSPEANVFSLPSSFPPSLEEWMSNRNEAVLDGKLRVWLSSVCLRAVVRITDEASFKLDFHSFCNCKICVCECVYGRCTRSMFAHESLFPLADS